MLPRIDPTLGLSSKTASNSADNGHYSLAQIKETLKLLHVISTPADALTHQNSVASPHRNKKAQRRTNWHTVLKEIILHSEILHIIISLFLSIVGWAFERRSRRLSINMSNFLILIVYLPFFFHSHINNNRAAPKKTTLHRSIKAFVQHNSLKDIVLEPVRVQSARDATFLQDDGQENTSLFDKFRWFNLFKRSTVVPLQQNAHNAHLYLQATDTCEVPAASDVLAPSRLPTFQAWRPVRLGDSFHSAHAQLDLDSELTDFLDAYVGSFISDLQSLSSADYIVVRNGEFVVVQAWCIVPGDVLILTEGRVVPCDCTILPVYFTQIHSLPSILLEKQTSGGPVSDLDDRVRPFCPSAVSYGLARRQPSIFCTFPAETVVSMICHYNIHLTYKAANIAALDRMRSMRSRTSSEVHDIFTQDLSDMSTAGRTLSHRMRPLLRTRLSLADDASSSYAKSLISSVTPFYTESLRLVPSVHKKFLPCGYKVEKIKGSAPIVLENIALNQILNAFATFLYIGRKITDATLPSEDLARLSILCMKLLAEKFSARKVSSGLVDIPIGRGVRVCAVAVGKDVSVLRDSESFVEDMQKLDLNADVDTEQKPREQKQQKLSKLSKLKNWCALRKARQGKEAGDKRVAGVFIERKQEILKLISVPSAFFASTLSIEKLFRTVSMISVFVSMLLIVIPVVAQVLFIPELRTQYLTYWNPRQTDIVDLFLSGFIPSFCSALVFGLISGLFLHSNIIYLRPIISVAAKYLSGLTRRNVHMHTLGALEATSFTNTVIIDESLLLNISGSHVHKAAPSFWSTVTMKLAFVYIAGEGTSERFYRTEDILLQGSILTQDIVAPLWPLADSNLLKLDPTTWQYSMIGVQKHARPSLAAYHSHDDMESTGVIDNSKLFVDDARIKVEKPHVKSIKRLHDIPLCFMRFLVCVTMEPGDVAHILREHDDDQTIFTPDYAFEVISPLNGSSSTASGLKSARIVPPEHQVASQSLSNASLTQSSFACNQHLSWRNMNAAGEQLIRDAKSSAIESGSNANNNQHILKAVKGISNDLKKKHKEDFKRHMLKSLVLSHAKTLKGIRSANYSATVRRYGMLITPGCLQNSHVSVSQVHPLLTNPLSIYIAYVEKQDPIVVVKSSLPGYLLARCTDIIETSAQKGIRDGLNTFPADADPAESIFCYRKITSADRCSAIAKVGELSKTCHELVIYAVVILDSTKQDWEGILSGNLGKHSLVYIGALGFNTVQKDSPTAFISQFTELSNGANLIITTHRSIGNDAGNGSNCNYNSGSSTDALGCNTNRHKVCSQILNKSVTNHDCDTLPCANLATDMDALLRALNLDTCNVSGTKDADKDVYGDADPDINNICNEAISTPQAAGIDKVQPSTTTTKIPGNKRNQRNSANKAVNVLSLQSAQARKCFITSDFDAIRIYTLTKMRNNPKRLLISRRLARKHMRNQRQQKPVESQTQQQTSETNEDGCISTLAALAPIVDISSDTEGSEVCYPEDERTIASFRTHQPTKYAKRAAALLRNKRDYAIFKGLCSPVADDDAATAATGATDSLGSFGDSLLVSIDNTSLRDSAPMQYPIIAPSQTWKAIRGFLNNPRKFYNLTRRKGAKPGLPDTEMPADNIPNIFIVPQSSPIEVAARLSQMGTSVTLILPNRVSTSGFSVTENDILQDNNRVMQAIQHELHSRDVPKHLSVFQDKVLFSRKPDFLVVGYERSKSVKQDAREFGLGREDYRKLRGLVDERISVCYTAGQSGLQKLRDVAMESPHFFLSVFPVFVGTVRSRLLQGIFPLTLAVGMIIEIVIECSLNKYELINAGIKPWYYPPMAVGVILITNYLFNDIMTPLIMSFSLRASDASKGISRATMMVTQSRIMTVLMLRMSKISKRARSKASERDKRTSSESWPVSNKYHLEALMVIAERFSRCLQKPSLIVFALVFIVLSTITLIPLINYQYSDISIPYNPMFTEADGSFASVRSQKFVAFTTVLMILLFMSFSNAAFFVVVRAPAATQARSDAQRCMRWTNVFLFFIIQFVTVYVAILLPIKMPLVSLLISNFSLSEQNLTFWNNMLLSIGISCVVLTGVILEQAIPLLE